MRLLLALLIIGAGIVLFRACILARRADKAPLSGRELRGAIVRDAGRGGEEACMSGWEVDDHGELDTPERQQRVG